MWQQSWFIDQDILYTMAESATPVKLFGKWSLEDVEVSDLALVVRIYFMLLHFV